MGYSSSAEVKSAPEHDAFASADMQRGEDVEVGVDLEGPGSRVRNPGTGQDGNEGPMTADDGGDGQGQGMDEGGEKGEKEGGGVNEGGESDAASNVDANDVNDSDNRRRLTRWETPNILTTYLYFTT